MSLTLVPQSMTQNVFNGSNRNLIQYADFENQMTTGWSLGTIGTLTNGLPTGTPTFGSGSAGLAMAISNTSPIDGTGHLLLTASAATTAGNMLASDAITMPPALRAKVVSIAHLYSILSGAANLNLSGTLLNSLGMALWDATNSAFIPVNGSFNYVQNTGAPTAFGTAQIPFNCASVRLCVYFPTASAGAFTLGVKNFYLGGQSIVQGFSGSDWQPFVPVITGFGTVSNLNGKLRSVGDTYEFQVFFTSGTATAVLAKVGLPVTIDNSKLAFPVFYNVLGEAGVNGSGANAFAPISETVSSNFVYISLQNSGSDALTPKNGSSLLISGQSISMKFSAPIVGKSSNNQSSTDTDGRAVSFSVTTSSTAASPTQPFIYTSVVDDSHGAYSSTTGQYKIAVPGRYTFNANTYTGTTSAAIGLYRNGTMIFQGPSTVGNSSVANMSYTGPFALNDLVDVRPLAAATGSGTAAGTLFSGSRVSGNAAISLGETIACAYNSGTNQQTLTNNALTTINVYTVKEYDTHGAFNTTTGTFTAPAPGIYTVQTGLQFGVNATGSRYAYIQSPGSSGKLLNYQNGNGSIPTQLMGGCSFRLATGGQIFIQAVQSSGGALATANDGTGTFICITKTG